MKKTIKRYTPSAKQIKSNKYLRWLTRYFKHQHLWHFNRRSIANATAIGLFCAFIPIPFQMVLAAIFAILFAGNLAVAIAWVWITNPITMPAIFYTTYQLGAWLLNKRINQAFEFSFDYFATFFSQIWQPLLLGSLLTATISGLLGYLLVQGFFRWRIYQRIKNKRKHKKKH